MTTRIGTERVLIVGDASSIERAGLTPGDGCEVDVVSSLEEGILREEANPYDRVIVDPSVISGPPMQVISTTVSSTARQNAALVEAEERKLLAESAGGVGLWEWDLVTGEAEWDPACKALYGLAPDAPVSLDIFLSLVHPDDRDEFFRMNEECLDHPCEFLHTFRAILPDGTQRWFRNKGRSVADETGAVVRLLGASVDVTERKEAEDALRESEDRFREMADGISIMIWVTDAQGNMLFVNRAYCEFFGVDLETVQREGWQPLVHPDDAPAYVAAYAEALREAKPFHGVTRVRNARGEWRWIESFGRPRFSESGELVRMTGSSPDITDRKEAEDALIEQGQLLSATIESADVEIAYLDREFRFVMANDAYIKGSGHTWAELSERNHFELFPDEENEAIFRRARDSGEAVRFKAKPFEYADQPWRGVTYWDWSLVPVKDIDGEVSGLVFSLHDVTDIKRAEERILRSNERLTILSDTANELLLSERPRDVIHRVCERVMEHLDCQVFLYYDLIDERNCFHLSDWAGFPEDEARNIEWIDSQRCITGKVGRSGKPFVAQRISERTDALTSVARYRGLRAYACYPLLSRGGRAIGTLAFATKTRDAFADDELSMIQTVADEVATALERVRTIEAQKELYERERHIADVLQQALVPPNPPTRIGGCRFAVRYRAAMHEAAVGGDFYDIYDMGDGRTGVVIGDVAGKGLEAAIRVAAARHSIRSYSYVEPSAGRVMSLANDAICRDEYEGSRMLTALFVVIEEGAETVTYTNAGHGPMFWAGRENGALDLLHSGIPLGVLPGYAYGEESTRFRRGDRIVLVTDGITEARREGTVFFGDEGVRAYLDEHRTDGAEELAEGILNAAADFAEGALQDDAAVVVIERLED